MSGARRALTGRGALTCSALARSSHSSVRRRPEPPRVPRASVLRSDSHLHGGTVGCRRPAPDLERPSIEEARPHALDRCRGHLSWGLAGGDRRTGLWQERARDRDGPGVQVPRLEPRHAGVRDHGEHRERARDAPPGPRDRDVRLTRCPPRRLAVGDGPHPDQSRAVLEAGRAAGLIPKIHANQLGFCPARGSGSSSGAASADHCTYLDDADIDALAGSDTVATFHTGDRLLHEPAVPRRPSRDRSVGTNPNTGRYGALA